MGLSMLLRQCASGVGAVAIAAGASGVTTFDGSLDAGVVIGSGIPNANFVVDTQNGVQTGIKALERFVGDLSNSGSTYFAPRGESPASGAAGAPLDPGTASWNYLFSVDLGSARTFADVSVVVSIDFNPAVGNTNFFEFELVSALGAQGVDITGASLFQDSQNLGFNFWQAIGDPDISPFDPFAGGDYFMSVEVFDNATGELLSGVDMNVLVPVPLPATGGLAGLGLLCVAGRRRR